MEEQVKAEEVKVEVVEEKKKGLSKKVLVIGGALVGLAVAGIVAITRSKDGGDVQNQIVDTTYESVTESEVAD